MIIELLYFADCPNYDPALQRIQQAIKQERVVAEITRIEVLDDRTAQSLRFRGSPTIRVNGFDVESAPGNAGDYGLCCRTYWNEPGVGTGAPSVDLIRRAIREFGAVPAQRGDCFK